MRRCWWLLQILSFEETVNGLFLVSSGGQAAGQHAMMRAREDGEALPRSQPIVPDCRRKGRLFDGSGDWGRTGGML